MDLPQPHLHAVGRCALVVYGLTTDVWITLAVVLFVPLYRADGALKAWPWAAGVMLGLSLAWSKP